MTAKKSDEATRGSERTTAKPGEGLSGGDRSESGNETKISFPSDREILITRVFNAPRDRVFKAFCDPKLIPEWWGPARYPTTVEVMDVRPGGKWRYVSRAEDGTEFGFHGEYREVAPPERVSQTFEFEGMPGHVSVDTATFEEIGGKTKLTIRTVFASKEDRDGMVQSGMESGLRESHERFEALMAKTSGIVEITRIFDAPRERVWKAWTDSEQAKRWFGPKEFTVPSCTIDLRVGGKFVYCMRSPDGKDFWGLGVYREIAPFERIVYTDTFADEHGNPVPASHYGMGPDIPLEMLVTVTFEDVHGKTKMTLRHAGLPAGEHALGAQQGWSQSFDKLEASLGSGPANASATRQGFTIERTFRAPPAKVWEMWTTKAGLEKWFTGPGWTSRVTHLDVRVGGEYEITMSDGKQTIKNHGTYTEIVPNRRLIYTWHFDIFLGPGDKPYDVPMSVTFEAVPAGTKMIFTQGPLDSAEHTEGSRQGVLANFERLAKTLEG